MPRRIRLNPLRPGDATLPAPDAHHVRDVLRLGAGDALELFDDAGALADGTILSTDDGVRVRVGPVRSRGAAGLRWVVASAVPKAARADWLVEKLGELGADAFIPLAAQRSVVLPEGKGKAQRWDRLAGEAARQSGRRGVMRILPLTPLPKAMRDALADCGVGWYLATEIATTPITEALAALPAGVAAGRLTLFVGPEGGWSPAELAAFAEAGLTAIGLTATILRVETAAVAAAAVVASTLSPRSSEPVPQPSPNAPDTE